jgi:hypothetical protein
MSPQLRMRTLGTLLGVVAIMAVNTVLSFGLGLYTMWFSVAVIVLAFAMLFVVLRLQQRLSGLQTALILSVPLLLAAAGALIGV